MIARRAYSNTITRPKRGGRYYHEDPAVILTDVETKVIQSFPFEELYNFKKEADSMLGYKHTAEAIEKIVSNSGP